MICAGVCPVCELLEIECARALCIPGKDLEPLTSRGLAQAACGLTLWERGLCGSQLGGCHVLNVLTSIPRIARLGGSSLRMQEASFHHASFMLAGAVWWLSTM